MYYIYIYIFFFFELFLGKPSKNPLHPDYVPSIFPFKPASLTEGAKNMERFERHKRRQSATMSSATTTASPAENCEGLISTANDTDDDETMESIHDCSKGM